MLRHHIACQGVQPLQISTNHLAGRLAHHLQNWQAITQDRWVLSTVQGYKIDFLSNPHQKFIPHPAQFSTEQRQLITEEITELLLKGAIEEVNTPPGYYSNLFLVPKKDGGQRPVINLISLNEFVRKEHFKMEGIHNLKDLLQPGNWLAKVDLKDAFFPIPMHNQCRKYLRFTFQGKTYQFTCLPFGLCSAPWVFTKTLKPALATLRQKGVKLIAQWTTYYSLRSQERQYSIPGRVNIPVNKSRVYSTEPSPSSGISGSNSRLLDHGATSSTLKNKEHKSRSSKDSKIENNDCSSTGMRIGYDECNLVCHSPQHLCSVDTYRWHYQIP